MNNTPNFSFSLDTNAKPISVISAWNTNDYLGALKVRTTLKRNNYIVAPGLYSIGQPNGDSEVLISANYKLSFDILRRNLKGINAWIIVLDTKGVNVWCAAGKGTFGTAELIERIKLTGIKYRINHKRIIVPQLGAPGIEAHKVKQATGLNVKYGPVRANDIKAFLNSNLVATEEMRRVKFTFTDRLVLVPVEVTYSAKYLLLAILSVLLLSGMQGLSFSLQNILSEGPKMSLIILFAFLSGTVIGPLLLPALPFRSLSLKGLFSGFLTWLILFLLTMNSLFTLQTFAFLLIFLTLGSFFTMNFTGATTYTSLSGVQKEMKYAVPAQIIAGALSTILLIISRFI